MSSSSAQKPVFTNLLITAGVVLLVTALAIVFKQRSPRQTTSDVVPKAVPVTQPSVPTGSTKPIRDSFEQFPAVTLVQTPDNEPDTFKVNLGTAGEHVFTLYFVDALETNFKQTKRIKEQSAHFAGATTEAIVETGRDAMKTVQQELGTRPFRLLTRWEKHPETQRYLALVLVQLENEQWTYLGDLLLRQGFARVQGISTPLPDDSRALEDYNAELRTHAKFAKDRRLGIWARVKG
jgi:endonuclease YncB( thermonuclease family)